MRSGLLLAALGLLAQGAAQAQYIPATPYPPYTFGIKPWNQNQTVVPWIPWNNGDGVINWIDPSLPFPQEGMTLVTVAPADLLETRVSLELDNVPLKEAIQKLFDQAPQGCTVELDKDAPKDIRITLRARNIKFSTALNALTEQANLIWNPSLHLSGVNAQPRAVFHLSKAPQERKAPSSTFSTTGRVSLISIPAGVFRSKTGGNLITTTCPL